MQQRAVHIRRARPDEAEALTALIMRSKAHWGYSQQQLDGWRSVLTMAAATIERDAVFCAEVDGVLAGVLHVKMLDDGLNDGEALLDDLFIEPAYMGAGVGGALWRLAATLAREAGARVMVLYADRNAIPFYQHMGMAIVHADELADTANVSTPLMRCDLAE
jgi:ribosomal protein S18 acetylase RimI-like enzyme